MLSQDFVNRDAEQWRPRVTSVVKYYATATDSAVEHTEQFV